MEPFRGMFPSQPVSDQSVLDVSLLFAMIVYSIVGIAVQALVAWLTDRIVAQRRRQHVAWAAMPASGAATEPGGPAPHYPPGVPTGPGPSYR
jgi:hypothetical protein